MNYCDPQNELDLLEILSQDLNKTNPHLMLALIPDIIRKQNPNKNEQMVNSLEKADIAIRSLTQYRRKIIRKFIASQFHEKVASFVFITQFKKRYEPLFTNKHLYKYILKEVTTEYKKLFSKTMTIKSK
ncbi:hypothetical protein BD560DRAFT_428091 [Blakeslea trispora]|nr:hypothetical protein BD560DRAFT_428091 [Blakeslea trispora]